MLDALVAPVAIAAHLGLEFLEFSIQAGKADAQATLIYAQALGRDPEFYSFIQTLDIYKDTMDKSTSLVLSTDSELLRFFKGYEVKQKGK